MNITVSVKWMHTDASNIEVPLYGTVGQSLEAFGFASSSTSRVIFCYKGKVMNQSLTFSSYDIKDGDLIIAYLQKLPDPSKKERFLARLNRKSGHSIDDSSRYYFPVVDVKRQQSARMADNNFRNWEGQKEYQIMLHRLYEAQNKPTVEPEMPLTVIPEPKISEEAIPLLPADNNKIEFKSHTYSTQDSHISAGRPFIKFVKKD